MSLFTEDEAKTKWCPMARYDDNINRDGTNDAEFSPCIASGCMAWRAGVWDHQRNLTPENRTPGVGYCGAFGKPS